jgi:TPR repeat protein
MFKAIISGLMTSIICANCFGALDTQSLQLLGEAVANGDVHALAELQSDSNQGDAIAQYGLGILYSNGLGIKKDDSAADEWYRKSAEQGNDKAQYSLGFNYIKGLGVSKDVPEGIRWLQMSAQQGNDKAEFFLAASEFTGEYIPQNIPESLKWLKLASEHGNTTAGYLLVMLYSSDGNGVQKDEKEATKWANLTKEQELAKFKKYELEHPQKKSVINPN